MLIFGGSENEIKGDVILFDLQKNVFKRLAAQSEQDEADDQQPRAREFHQAVYDPYSHSMFVVAGSDKMGRVNSLHRYRWRPEDHYGSTYAGMSMVSDDIGQLFEHRTEKQSFLNFELTFKN